MGKSNHAPKELSMLLVSTIVHVLKCYSTKENPITHSDLWNKANAIAINNITRDTFDNYMEALVAIMSGQPYQDIIQKYVDKVGLADKAKKRDELLDLFDNLKNSFKFTYGGVIKRVGKKGTGRKYYFEPLLEHGEVSMITGAIISNPYLSDLEKEYLATRVKALSSYDDLFNSKLYQEKDEKQNADSRAAKNKKKLQKSLKTGEDQTPFKDGLKELQVSKELEEDESLALLNEDHFFHLPNTPGKKLLLMINNINEAIALDCKIEVEYGIYSIDNRTKKPKLVKKQDEPYILDPYALCWNGGFYYLICKNPKYDMPSHFRVDRMMKVSILRKEKRAKLPKELAPFFKKKGTNNVPVFDTVKYNNTYPLMSINRENKKVNCVFETRALSILVDYFGNSKISVQSTNKTDKAFNEKEMPIYKASILDVEYESAKLFALQQHDVVHIVSPQKLVDDVKKTLGRSYRNM